MEKKNKKQQQKSESKPVITHSYSVGQTDIASPPSPPRNLDVVAKIGATESSTVSPSETLSKNPSPRQPLDSLHLSHSPKQKPLWQQKLISFFQDKWNLLFLVVLFIGFLLRLKYVGQESIWNDSAVHLWYAIKVTHHPFFLFTPQYLLGDYGIVQTIMAFFYFFTNNILLSGQIVAIFYFLLAVIFIYLLGTELKNKFSGLIAATILTFNHLFWFYSVRPLGDSPLLATTIILLYAVVKLEKTKKVSWGIFAGSMFLVALFTKEQAVLFVFALLIYYLIFKRKEMLKEKAVLYSWLIPTGIVLLGHFIGVYLFHVGMLDRIFQLFLDQRGMPFGFEAAKMLQWLVSWYVILPAVVGLIFVFIYKQKEYYFPIILTLFYYLFFEINVDNTQDRYMLPLLAIFIVLAAFALDEVGNYLSFFVKSKKAKYVLIIPIILLISWSYYQIGDPLIYNKSFSYLGYQEAGQWIKENIPVTDPLFAGEYRSIRLFSEREYGGPEGEDYGGNVINLRSELRYLAERGKTLEQAQKNFEDDVAVLSQKRDVYLEIDVWEYAQPAWYYPLSQNSVNYFSSLGFKPVKVVEREVQTKDGLKKAPVIFILKKDRVSANQNASSPLPVSWNNQNKWLQKFVS